MPKLGSCVADGERQNILVWMLMSQVFTAVLQTQSVQSLLLMRCCWDLGERNKPELSSGIIRPLRSSSVAPEYHVTSMVDIYIRINLPQKSGFIARSDVTFQLITFWSGSTWLIWSTGEIPGGPVGLLDWRAGVQSCHGLKCSLDAVPGSACTPQVGCERTWLMMNDSGFALPDCAFKSRCWRMQKGKSFKTDKRKSKGDAEKARRRGKKFSKLTRRLSEQLVRESSGKWRRQGEEGKRKTQNHPLRLWIKPVNCAVLWLLTWH